MEKAYFIAVKWLERYVGLQNAYKQYSHDRHLTANFVAAVVSILMRPSFLSTQKSPEEEIKAERKI